MKHTIYITLIFLLAALTSCTQREVVITEAQLPDDIFYLKDEIKPFTGRCLIYFTGSEKIKEEMYYKKGYLDGKRVSYYKNGEIKIEGEYLKGKYNGIWKRYTEAGDIIYMAEYINDSLVNYVNYTNEEQNRVMFPNLVTEKRVKMLAWIPFK